MLLKGSCHCGAVRFSVQSHQPVPFMRCYCSICRKTAGSGGFAINLGADHATLQVQGREHLSVYRAKLRNGRAQPGAAPLLQAVRQPAVAVGPALARTRAPARRRRRHAAAGAAKGDAHDARLEARLGGGSAQARRCRVRRVPRFLTRAVARASPADALSAPISGRRQAARPARPGCRGGPAPVRRNPRPSSLR